MSDHPLKPAYEATDYRVGDRFTIRCGERSPPLDALLAESGQHLGFHHGLKSRADRP